MSGGGGDPLNRRCPLRTLNEMITCKICHGYLIDATTVTECLHTFCKSCIVKHLEDSNVCPECEATIHQSHPLDYVAFDRTLQDLVYKIVPGLEQDEFKRERRFYADRGLPCPKDQALLEASPELEASSGFLGGGGGNGAHGHLESARKHHHSSADPHSTTQSSVSNATPDANTNMDFHRFDEQVNLLLECQPHPPKTAALYATTSSENNAQQSRTAGETEQGQEHRAAAAAATEEHNKRGAALLQPQSGLKRKFVRCSALATVTHLKKFIAKKLLNSSERYKDVAILCNDEPLYKDHTLKFVYVTRWRTKDPPMCLQYYPSNPSPNPTVNSSAAKVKTAAAAGT